MVLPFLEGSNSMLLVLMLSNSSCMFVLDVVRSHGFGIDDSGGNSRMLTRVSLTACG